MIISASRRTDIPAYYAEWFMNRIRAGYLLVRNPFNNAQVKRVDLTPDMVDCIVFWTKDPEAMMPCLDELDAGGYSYYFQFTLTPYGIELEPRLRPKDDIMQTFRKLSNRLGKNRVVWRYDPVVLNDEWHIERHFTAFRNLCRELEGYTDMVVISFVDMYKRVRSPYIRAITQEEIAIVGESFAAIALSHGVEISACCEKTDLSVYGIGKASCIDISRVQRVSGRMINSAPHRSQREGCGCATAVDVGVYNTCLHGCVYCYATYSNVSAGRNFARHDPAGELLLG